MNILEFESAAFTLYNSTNNNEKNLAQDSLNNLKSIFQSAISPSVKQNSIELLFYQSYLEQVSSPYSQVLLFQKLRLLCTSQFTILPIDDVLALRSFILQFLSTKNDLQSFVISSACQLFGCISFLGWFISAEFQNIHQDTIKFLSATPHFQKLGMDLMNATISEMNYSTSSLRKFTKHRKTAVSFRDSQLLQIFTTSLKFLKHLLNNLAFSDISEKLQESTLSVCKNSLYFDFIGVNPDESSEDIGSIQIPQSWKETIVDESTMSTFYDAFINFKNQSQHRALECFSLLVSTRRSLFNDQEKIQSLERSLSFISNISLYLKSHPNEDINHHEFSRTLARMKHVYQSDEIINNCVFQNVRITLVSYTIDRLNLQWDLSTMTYLFTFWGKIASSIPHAKDSRSTLQNLLAEDFNAMFTAFASKIDSDNGIEEVEGFFEEENEFCIFLDAIAPVIRTNYDICTNLVEGKITYWIPQYENFFKALSPTRQATVFENNMAERIARILSFCIYLAGAAVGARMPYESTEEHDYQDGILAATVLQIMNGLGNFTRFVHERLELAFLNFMQQFRKIYIGDSTHRASKVYKRLSEMLHMSDQNEVLNAIVKKLENNLKYCFEQELLMKDSLALLVELSNGYSSVRTMRKSETAQFILANHSEESFPFLGIQGQEKNRTMFYYAITKILFASDSELSDAEFADFVKPFSIKLQCLMKIPDVYGFAQPEIRNLTEGLFRDLRGVVSGCISKKAYMLFFEWIFPYFEVFQRVFESNINDKASISILRFLSEFVTNTSQRLSFDISSPNGALLFQQCSRILFNLGRYLIPLNVIQAEIWSKKYKKSLLYFEIFKNILSGKYVPFGVFKMFNDVSLENVLEGFFQLSVSIPESDLLTYPKLSSSFFGCLSVLSGEQLMSMQDLDGRILEYLLKVCIEGIKSDAYTSSQACSIIDNIVSFVIKQNNKPHFLCVRLSEMQNVIHFMMISILEVVLLSEPDNLWSLSRPLLPLILIDQAFFTQYVQGLCSNQIANRQAMLSAGFTGLMDGVNETVSSKNRDKFTQNLQAFRRELNMENIVLN